MRRTPDLGVEHGTVRERSGLLWRPKKIAGQWRWLELPSWKEVYVVSTGCADWRPLKWLD